MYTVGTIASGIVEGIKPFGAFVKLENGKRGLVHISEIADSYVASVADHLTEGQAVQVRIVDIDASGRLNLSMKKAVESDSAVSPAAKSKNQPRPRAKAPQAPPSFEDKLKQFMQESSSKMSGVEAYTESKRPKRRR